MDLIHSFFGLGFLLFLAIFIWLKKSWFRTQFLYFYSCVLKRISSSKDSQSRLEAFYCDQIQIYDETRQKLLRGRLTMLKLCAAELESRAQTDVNKNGNTKIPLVWVDIGGGTGWNIEQMNSFYPIKNFDAIYLVDLTPAMCSAAQERFARLGWDQVKVICADGSNFQVPESVEGAVNVITMSYSLSMMDNFYEVVDRVRNLLHPDIGIVAVADFYVSGRTPKPSNGLNRQCNWFSRWFWQIYFSFDYIELHPSRRDYLEHCFQSIKEYNSRNHFVIPYLCQMPYYVWLGQSKSKDIRIRQSERNVKMQWLRLPYDSTLPIHFRLTSTRSTGKTHGRT